jgi:hypothetical protein
MQQPPRPSHPQGPMTTRCSGYLPDYGAAHLSSGHARIRDHERRGSPPDAPEESRAHGDILAAAWRFLWGEPLALGSVAKECSTLLLSSHRASGRIQLQRVFGRPGSPAFVSIGRGRAHHRKSLRDHARNLGVRPSTLPDSPRYRNQLLIAGSGLAERPVRGWRV